MTTLTPKELQKAKTCLLDIKNNHLFPLDAEARGLSLLTNLYGVLFVLLHTLNFFFFTFVYYYLSLFRVSPTLKFGQVGTILISFF